MVNEFMKDPLYLNCFSIPNMDPEAAIKVVYVKRSLDEVLPTIPDEIRSGINSFSGYFIAIINVSVGGIGSVLVSGGCFHWTDLRMAGQQSDDRLQNHRRACPTCSFLTANITLLTLVPGMCEEAEADLREDPTVFRPREAVAPIDWSAGRQSGTSLPYFLCRV